MNGAARLFTLSVATLATALLASATEVTITEFPLPTAGNPALIAAGPDGNLWFTELNGNKVGRITPAGVVTEFPVPTADCTPNGIASGPDGNLWFTEMNYLTGNKIGRITTAGVITEFPVPTTAGVPLTITSGPDGNLWFTEANGKKIGRITTAGTITEFAIPSGGSPNTITSGPDGNVWFTEFVDNRIGRITPAGVITEFLIPTANTEPQGIVAGPDGNLWFTETNYLAGNKIGRITTTGVVTEFPVPTPSSYPEDIVSGPDGALWFVENGANKIGRITTAGVITEFPIPTTSSAASGIATGPDGNLWFTEFVGNKIGRISLAQVGGRRIYSNFGPAMAFDPNVGWTISGSLGPGTAQYAVAHQFTPVATDTFTSAQLALMLFAGPGSVTVFLQADSAGLPGPVLEQIELNGLTSEPAVFTAVSALRPQLNGGTPYWLSVVASGTGVDAAWNWNVVGDVSTATNLAGTQGGSPAGPWSLAPALATRSAFQINGGGLLFFTLTPCRVLDTRGALGPLGGPALSPDQLRSFPFAGVCGIPSEAVAVSGNVTAVAPSAAGDFRVYPADHPVPPTTAINFNAGRTRANNLVVALSFDGTQSVAIQNDSAAAVDAVFDVNGYFR